MARPAENPYNQPMPSLPDSPLLALVGPGEGRPCGIGDYIRRLEPALARRCRLRRID